jgi:hypothetical protein
VLFPQKTLIETSQVINIEVPVRVFKDGRFVGNLKIKDFEVFENGKLQKIEAVYLIKKDSVQQREEKKKFNPQIERTFFLFFEVWEYLPKLKVAMDYFINKVLLPGDNLIAVTPIKTYRLKDNGLKIKPREEISKELRELLRKDTILGSSEYRSTIRDLKENAKDILALILDQLNDETMTTFTDVTMMELPELLSRYAVNLQKLEVQREIDELNLLDFAKYLKNRDGQKFVFIFYQREFIPQLEPRILTQVMGMFQDNPAAEMDISSLFNSYSRDISINIDRVKQAYADSGTSIHFMYITKPAERIPGIRMQEHSEDMFASFYEMAKASGGLVESSSNPDFLFKSALNASENYYLLYYSPKNYNWDGKFRNIKVRVNGKSLKVVHRLGYFAN